MPERVNGRAPRICVIASGHITTSPRVMKAAEALREAGHDVRLVFSSPSARFAAADDEWLSAGGWQADVYRFDRDSHFANYVVAGVRHHAARRMVKALGVRGRSTATLGLNVTRAFPGLVRAAVATGADFYYGGTAGGLAVAAEAARRTGRPYALDLEDFHTAENDPSPHAQLTHAVIAEIERRILPGAAFLTCGSDAMGAEYEATYGVHPQTINNVFSLTDEPSFAVEPGVLRIIWLSQTVGPGRGLEDAIAAIGLAQHPTRLTLRGVPVPGYLDELRSLARARAPNLELVHREPDMSQTPVELCRGNDVGLALEQAHVLNRAVCLCNKPFTYMLAGLSVVFTDTPGQRPLARDLGPGGALVEVGDLAAMAARLKALASDATLIESKRAAWAAASRRWHWEHPEERGKLLGLFSARLGAPPA